MTITEKRDGKKLELNLEGRLDTMTAPELEAKISQSIGDIDSLVLNFEKLDYISSAGLRVLLATHKNMAGKEGLHTVNVNDLVQEVFEVTGFADILNID